MSKYVFKLVHKDIKPVLVLEHEGKEVKMCEFVNSKAADIVFDLIELALEDRNDKG